MARYKFKTKYFKGKILIFTFNSKDVYDNGVRPEKGTQIQIWKDTSILPEHQKWSDYLFNITRDGYRAILSSPWYINFVSYGYQEWYKYYQVEPLGQFKG